MIRMELRWVAAVLVLTACGSSRSSSQASSDGAGSAGVESAGASGASANNAGASGANANNAGTNGEACPSDHPAVLASATARINLPVRVSASGVPLSTGQAVTPASGVPYQLSLLKFFVSQPVLLAPNGARV